MKNIQKLLLLCLFAANQMHGQMAALFTQYTDLQTYLNPAALSTDFLNYQKISAAGLTARMQWLGLDKEDSPFTGLARFDYTLEGNSLSTFGGFLLADKVGASNITGLYGRYAYQFRPSIQEDMYVGVGLLAGLLQYRVRASQLQFEDGDRLQADVVSKLIPDFGVGVNFVANPQRGMKFYAGLSLPQVASLGAKFQARDNDQEFVFRRPLHLLGNMGFVIPVGQQGFIEPSIWVKQTKGQPINVDINIRQKFVNNFWLGLGWGSSNTIHAEAGLIVNQSVGLSEDNVLRIGYGFDYGLNGAYNAFFGTTHEINITYAFGEN